MKSLWEICKIWNPIIATCLDEAKAMHCEATGSDELDVGMWGNQGVLQVLLITKRLER